MAKNVVTTIVASAGLKGRKVVLLVLAFPMLFISEQYATLQGLHSHSKSDYIQRFFFTFAVSFMREPPLL